MDLPSTTRWWLLAAMGAILGVILLDETVVSVALSTIEKDLGLSRLDAHWVVNIYLLVLAGLSGASGRLGDIFGARPLLIAGLFVFGLSSAFGGFAGPGAALIFARAMQGVGAALIFPLSMVVVTHSFHDHERGIALGLYGSIGTVFLSLGPLVGGALTEYLSWRWIFWVNPPIVLVVAAITWTCWRDPPRNPETSFDYPGLLLLLGGLGLSIFAIMEGPDRGWSGADVLIPLCAGLILLGLFVLTERRAQIPLIAIATFTNPTFAASNLIVFTAQFVKIVLFVFGAFYFQTTMGLSPLLAGAALLPAVVPQVPLAPLAGKVADRFGSRWPSLFGVFGGTVAMIALTLGMASRNDVLIFGALTLWGCMAPFLFVPPRRAVLLSVPPQMHGQASGITMSCQLLGGTVGMAVGSTIFATTGSVPAVFWGMAAFTAGVLLYGFFAIDRPKTKPTG